MIATSIVITILLGIAASLFTEVATALNKVLNGTVLKGDGAFALAFGMAFLAAVIKEITMPGFDIHSLLNVQQLVQFFSETFTVSQIFFLLIYQKLGLDMNPTTGRVEGPAPVVVVPAVTAAAVSEV